MDDSSAGSSASGSGLFRSGSLGNASFLAALLVICMVLWAFVSPLFLSPATTTQTIDPVTGEPSTTASGVVSQEPVCGELSDASAVAGGHSSDTHTAMSHGGSHVDFFTNGGRYMQRIHCMPGEAGSPDWLWIILLLVLNGGVVAAYLRIYVFWRRSYLAEEERDRNHKLMDLAQIFLWCAVCGYVAGMVMFVWPAYRLLAVCLVILNIWSWRFAINLRTLRVSLSARRYRRLASADVLTGLPNRVTAGEVISQALSKYQRTHNPADRFAILFMDMDRFKRINDSLGHNVGDELLRQVASRLRNQTRQGDVVDSGVRGKNNMLAARIGGDEFVVVLSDTETSDQVAAVANRLIKAMSEPYELAGQIVRVTPSIGVTLVREESDSAEELICEADTAMYHAKAVGKSCWRMFDQQMQREAAERLMLEEGLRSALANDELTLALQPIMNLETGEVTCVEALARWNHKTLGPIAPDRFIKIAEETAQIADLGRWAVRASARWLSETRRAVPSAAKLRVQVNISRRQLQSSGMIGQLVEAVQTHGMSPSDFVLEATESTFVEDEGALIQTMTELRDAGFALALDDFGTGYSTLSNLHRFPIEQLKIDRSFFAQIHERQDYAAMVQAVTTLADNLGVEVVAEGIEDRNQIVMLQFLGCSYAQGYYIARPMPPDEACQWLQSWGGEHLAA